MVNAIQLAAARTYLAFTALRDREEGQAMVEYALLLFLVAIVSIVVLTVTGKRVSSLFNEIAKDI